MSMHNCFLTDEALLSINQAGRGQLVKLLITLEPHGIFGSNFAYLFILTLFYPFSNICTDILSQLG